jgi:hypothetical protein
MCGFQTRKRKRKKSHEGDIASVVCDCRVMGVLKGTLYTYVRAYFSEIA